MRIVSGRLRGRNLLAPPGDETRPTSDRAREGVFNILEHGAFAEQGSLLAGAHVIDAYAGTGALGLEAVSRGAASVTFFEAAPRALDSLRTNIKALGVGDRVRVVAGNAAQPARATLACGVMFLDPPYGEQLGPPTLEAFAKQGWLAEGAIVILEAALKENVSPVVNFEKLDERAYGAARFLFLRYSRIAPVDP